MKNILLTLAVISLTSFTAISVNPESATLDVTLKYHRSGKKLSFEYSVAASDGRPLTLVVNIYDPLGNQLLEGVMEESVSLSGSFNGAGRHPKTGAYRFEIKMKDKDQPIVIEIPAKNKSKKLSESFDL